MHGVNKFTSQCHRLVFGIEIIVIRDDNSSPSEKCQQMVITDLSRKEVMDEMG